MGLLQSTTPSYAKPWSDRLPLQGPARQPTAFLDARLCLFPHVRRRRRPWQRVLHRGRVAAHTVHVAHPHHARWHCDPSGVRSERPLPRACIVPLHILPAALAGPRLALTGGRGGSRRQAGRGSPQPTSGQRLHLESLKGNIRLPCLELIVGEAEPESKYFYLL